MAKGSKKQQIPLEEIIKTDSKSSKYPINIDRFTKESVGGLENQSLCYAKIASSLVKAYRKKEIVLEDFVFNADVFQVLKIHYGKKTPEKKKSKRQQLNFSGLFFLI